MPTGRQRLGHRAQRLSISLTRTGGCVKLRPQTPGGGPGIRDASLLGVALPGLPEAAPVFQPSPIRFSPVVVSNSSSGHLVVDRHCGGSESGLHKRAEGEAVSCSHIPVQVQFQRSDAIFGVRTLRLRLTVSLMDPYHPWPKGQTRWVLPLWAATLLLAPYGMSGAGYLNNPTPRLGHTGS